jgi:hypothetical protein
VQARRRCLNSMAAMNSLSFGSQEARGMTASLTGRAAEYVRMSTEHQKYSTENRLKRSAKALRRLDHHSHLRRRREKRPASDGRDALKWRLRGSTDWPDRD